MQVPSAEPTVRLSEHNTKKKRELELQPKEKITLRYPFTVPYQGDIELRLCRSSTGYPLASTTLTVDKEPHYYDIEVTDYKVVYKADEKDMTKAVECTLSLKSNDKRMIMGTICARIGNDGRENGGYDTIPHSLFGLLPEQSDEVQAILESDLTAIQEPTDLHLVVMIGYGDLDFIKLLDLVVKPGTIVTSKGTTTAISTIDAPNADAPFYDLQGRRVSRPRNGIYIHDGRKVVIK